MAFAKTVKSKQVFCWDCKKKIKIEGGEIKNGKMLIYDNQDKKISVFKCTDCFFKSKELRNFQPCEVYSRIVGYLRPIQQWNRGKYQEFLERKEYILKNKK